MEFSLIEDFDFMSRGPGRGEIGSYNRYAPVSRSILMMYHSPNSASIQKEATRTFAVPREFWQFLSHLLVASRPFFFLAVRSLKMIPSGSGYPSGCE